MSVTSPVTGRVTSPVVSRVTDGRRRRGVVAGFEPTDIPGGWWLDHTHAVTLSGTTVTEWAARGETKTFSRGGTTTPTRNANGITTTSAGTDYLVESVASDHANNFTLGFIYYESAAPQFASIISRFSTFDNNRTWGMLRNSGNTEFLLSGNGSSAVTKRIATAKYGERIAVVVRKSGTSLKIWVNGVLTHDTTDAPSTLFDSNALITIGARVGGSGDYAVAMDGSINHVCYWPTAITVSDAETLSDWLDEERSGIRWKIGGEILGEEIFDNEMTFTKTDYEIHIPSGSVVEGSYGTYTYLHHPIMREKDGKLYIAFSANLNNEDTNGQCVLGRIVDLDNLNNPGALTVIVPPQSDASSSRTHFLFPNQVFEYNNEIYVTAALQEKPTSSQYTRKAILAAKWNVDGTVGTPFKIDDFAYTTASGYTEYMYDGTLGPPLLALAVEFGRYGGSSNSFTFDWNRWFQRTPSGVFVAPGGGFILPQRRVNQVETKMRLLRIDVGGADRQVWSALQYDGIDGWTAGAETSIPDAPSNTWWTNGPNERLIVTGNPHDGVSGPDGDNGYRGVLYMGVTSPRGRTITSLGVLRRETDVSSNTAGNEKDGGPSYVHHIVIGSKVYAIYSIRKERIEMTVADIP